MSVETLESPELDVAAWEPTELERLVQIACAHPALGRAEPVISLAATAAPDWSVNAAGVCRDSLQNALLRAAAVAAGKPRFGGGVRNAMLLLEAQGVVAWTILHMLNERAGASRGPLHLGEMKYVVSAATAAQHLAKLRRVRDHQFAFSVAVGRLFGMPLLFCELGERFVHLVRFVRTRRCELSTSIRQALGFSQYDFSRGVLDAWGVGGVLDAPAGSEAEFSRALADGLMIAAAVHAPGPWERTLRHALGRAAGDRRSIRQFCKRVSEEVDQRLTALDKNYTAAAPPSGSSSFFRPAEALRRLTARR